MRTDQSRSLPDPPRDVPAGVRVAAAFGSIIAQIGYGLLAFGSVFFLIFGVKGALLEMGHFGGELVTVTGTVTGYERTSASVGGGGGHRRGSSRRRGTPVYATHYAFTDGDEVVRRGTSYATGKYLATGKECRVEYEVDDPSVSRIVGMRRTLFGTGIVFVAIFPGVGLIMAIVGTLRGMKAARLLEHGHVALGKLVDKQPTASRVNKRTVFRLTFEFTAADGQTHRAETKTHKPELLEDDVEEVLLYDAADPSSAVMFDTIPGKPRMDRLGRIAPTGSTTKLFILPALAAAALVVVLWW